MATKPEVSAAAPLCSKCGKNPRAGNGTNPWCRDCNSDYHTRYQNGRIEMSESRGYAAGCSAMRDQIARYFWQWPHVMFSGAEIAAMVQKLEDPGNQAIPHQG